MAKRKKTPRSKARNSNHSKKTPQGKKRGADKKPQREPKKKSIWERTKKRAGDMYDSAADGVSGATSGVRETYNLFFNDDPDYWDQEVPGYGEDREDD